MKLFYAPRTRANRPRWLLEELGVPYELVRIDPSKGEQKTTEHTARHPLQHVPVLETDDGPLFESAALCLHLADLYPEKKLLPPPGSYARGLVYQWLFYAMSELEPHGVAAARAKANKDEAGLVAEHGVAVKKLQVVEKALEGKQFLTGEFSVADVVLGAVVLWASRLGLVEGLPNLKAWTDRLAARPAYKKATAD